MLKLTTKQINAVCEKISVKNNHVILTDTMSDKNIVGDECNHNIYCINESNEIIWQVQVESTPFETAPYDGDPFVYVFIDDKGKLRANKFHGNEYVIDIKTGVAEQTGWHK